MGILSSVLPSLRRHQNFLQSAVGVTGLVIGASALGWLQVFELSLLDQFFRLRPDRPPDPRIVVIEVGEADIAALGQWPVSDAKLAEILATIQSQQPRLVGLDLYRDLPVPPGRDAWETLVGSMPNLIGVEKAAGDRVAPPPKLAEQGQVALADLVLDPDNKVRRGIISFGSTPETQQVGLGARLALSYLAEDGVFPVPSEDGAEVQLGATPIQRLEANSGSYRRMDDSGYQILLNYQGKQASFQQFSLTALLQQQIPAGALTDKIVLIGATAPSLNDSFLTPYNTGFSRRSQPLPGVYIHATITRQLLEAAENPSSMLRVLPRPAQWLWMGIWAGLGYSLTGLVLQPGQRGPRFWLNLPFALPPSAIAFLSIGSLSGGLFGLSYGCFGLGLWIPTASPLLALLVASILRLANQNQVLDRMASLDPMTQVANRRRFDQTLRENLLRPRPLCLILCDVDYFKPFNDTYGHLAGDDCLKQVAKAIGQAVRHTDIVARYGGEEFAIILPDTPPELAETIAERIRLKVMALQIEHQNSEVHPHVTLSCGVTSTERVICEKLSQVDRLAGTFIETADQALYLAKQQGRNSVVLKPL